MSPPFQCTSITNRVLSLFDRFTTYYNCMTWNVRKLISFPFQRISITNRVLNLFDCFTTYYNCMTWNFKKPISPPFQFTSITKPYLTFYDFLQLITWNVRKLISPLLSAQYHKLIWRFVEPFDLKCEKTHISAISVHSQILFLAYLNDLQL